MSELKPCPFCGKYPQTVVDDATEEKFGVKCFNCGGMIDAEKDTLQEAIEAWNKRVPSAQPQWIPVTERLPEEDVEVLITYRYKEGEGDTSHAYIDITTYGQMYFGGNKVGDHKHWRQPFEYFTSNYEVVAWMPLPEPYKEEQNGKNS